MYLHPVLVQVHGADEDLRNGGDQVFLFASDGVDLAGGVGVHGLELPQELAGLAIIDLEAQEVLVEVLALLQRGVGAADGEGLALIAQGGIHVVHTGKLQQDEALMDVVCRGAEGLAVQIEGLKAGEEVRAQAVRLEPDLAPGAVGVDDPAHGDVFQFHGESPFGYTQFNKFTIA